MILIMSGRRLHCRPDRAEQEEGVRGGQAEEGHRGDEDPAGEPRHRHEEEAAGQHDRDERAVRPAQQDEVKVGLHL